MKTHFRKVVYLDEYETDSFPLENNVSFDTIGVYSKNNNGELPNPWKMIQQGHGGLYRYIQRHQQEFKHLNVEKAVGKEPNKQNKMINFNVAIREEHIKKARRLALKNNGVLQDPNWLRKNGHTRLASYVKIYPNVFVDLV